MAIKYYRLFDQLNRRGLKKMDLLTMANISRGTLAKLSKGDPINTDTLDRICQALDVQPGDIMECVKDE